MEDNTSFVMIYLTKKSRSGTLKKWSFDNKLLKLEAISVSLWSIKKRTSSCTWTALTGASDGMRFHHEVDHILLGSGALLHISPDRQFHEDHGLIQGLDSRSFEFRPLPTARSLEECAASLDCGVEVPCHRIVNKSQNNATVDSQAHGGAAQEVPGMSRSHYKILPSKNIALST